MATTTRSRAILEANAARLRPILMTSITDHREMDQPISAEDLLNAAHHASFPMYASACRT